jgi:hypothetical protein
MLLYNCDQTLSYLVSNYSPLKANVVNITIKRIDRLVSLIKRLSQTGKGSLFVILLYDNPCDIHRPQQNPVFHEKAVKDILGEMLLKGNTSLHKFEHIIKRDDYALNVLDCDFLF